MMKLAAINSPLFKVNTASSVHDLDTVSFKQYAADNVDHDICSLDGSGTLHAMGVISVSYHDDDSTEPHVSETPGPRLNVLKAGDIVKMTQVPVLPCVLPPDPLAGISFQPHFIAANPVVLSSSINLWIFYGTLAGFLMTMTK